MRKKELVYSIGLISLILISCKPIDFYIDYSHSAFNGVKIECKFEKDIFRELLVDPYFKEHRKDLTIQPSLWDKNSCFGMFDVVSNYSNVGIYYPFYINKNNDLIQLYNIDSITKLETIQYVENEMSIVDNDSLKQFIFERISIGIIKLNASRSWSNNIENFTLLKDYYIPKW